MFAVDLGHQRKQWFNYLQRAMRCREFFKGLYICPKLLKMVWRTLKCRRRSLADCERGQRIAEFVVQMQTDSTDFWENLLGVRVLQMAAAHDELARCCHGRPPIYCQREGG